MLLDVIQGTGNELNVRGCYTQRGRILWADAVAEECHVTSRTGAPSLVLPIPSVAVGGQSVVLSRPRQKARRDDDGADDDIPLAIRASSCVGSSGPSLRPPPASVRVAAAAWTAAELARKEFAAATTMARLEKLREATAG